MANIRLIAELVEQNNEVILIQWDDPGFHPVFDTNQEFDPEQPYRSLLSVNIDGNEQDLITSIFSTIVQYLIAR